MDFKERLPIYLQIADRIMDEILAGKYPPDGRIPGVREYGTLLQVNVNTIVKAFDQLTLQGILYNRRGLGSFVSANAPNLIRSMRSKNVLNETLPELARQMQLLNIPLDVVVRQLEKLLTTTSPHI